MKKLFSLIVIITVCFGFLILTNHSYAQGKETKLPKSLAYTARSNTNDEGIMAIAVNAIWEKELGIPCVFTGEKGSNNRVLKSASGKVDFAFSQYSYMWKGYQGKGGFKKPLDIRMVIAHPEVYGCFITVPRTNIKTPVDFAGKRVAYSSSRAPALGEIGSSILEFYKVADKVTDIPNMPKKSRVSGLAENTVDVVFSWARHLDEFRQTNPKAYIVPVSKECAEYARSKYPYYRYSQIPKQYRNIEFDEPIGSVATKSGTICRASFPADLLYQLLKIRYDNYDKLTNAHPGFADETLDRVVDPNTLVPYHEGAIRFFKEKGVWTKEAEARQQALLSKK